jgi:DNA-binding GntR family transcriptional regulator
MPVGRAVPAFHSKSDIAYAEVRERILSGDLRPGGVISQAKLAAELGLSTTPLREALRRLAAEGLVILGSHRDARVVPVSSEGARNYYEVRSALDPRACALAAERRTDDDIAEIDAALAELEPLTGLGSRPALDAHRRFHRSIYRASRNPVLTDFLESLWDRSDLYRLETLRSWTPDDEGRARVHSEHVGLRDAVVAGDAHLAGERAAAHITGSLGRRAIGMLAADGTEASPADPRLRKPEADRP